MRVLGNRVLVKRIEDKALQSSIIEVVQFDKEPGHYALVVEVGQGRRLPNGDFIPIECKEGDVVILKKYSGAPVSLTTPAGLHEDFHLVDAEDVLAVVEKTNA
jgi:co-chaperonin GroES (HSP10)